MREPISLGYMLARLTDTFADTETLEVTQRLDLLNTTRLILQDSASSSSIPTQEIAKALDHHGETQLVLQSAEIFQWYRDCPSLDQQLISEVLNTIIDGQRWDLEFFHTQSSPIAASKQQLETYIYQVAGCVGEFWTKVGYAKLGHRFAHPDDRTELIKNGRALGEGLQLINILRDLHEDIPVGRHYLPPNDNLEEQFNHWLITCRSKLELGHLYVGKVRNRQVAFASALPLLLAEATADKLETAGLERVLNEKVKITRSEVFKRAIEAALYK